MAAKVITEDGGGDHQIIEASLANGAEDTYQFSVSTADAVLTATLVWMDPPGSPANNDDGFLTDNIGSKGGGQCSYEVCEPVPGICVSANTGF